MDPKEALQEINKILKSILNYICGWFCEGGIRFISSSSHWAPRNTFINIERTSSQAAPFSSQSVWLQGWVGEQVIQATTSQLFQLILQQIQRSQKCYRNTEPVSSTPLWNKHRNSCKQRPWNVMYLFGLNWLWDEKVSGQKHIPWLNVENHLNISIVQF